MDANWWGATLPFVLGTDVAGTGNLNLKNMNE